MRASLLCGLLLVACSAAPRDLVGAYEREVAPSNQGGAGMLYSLVLRADGTCKTSEQLTHYEGEGLTKIWGESIWSCEINGDGGRTVVVGDRESGQKKFNVRESATGVSLLEANGSLAYLRRR